MCTLGHRPYLIVTRRTNVYFKYKFHQYAYMEDISLEIHPFWAAIHVRSASKNTNSTLMQKPYLIVTRRTNSTHMEDTAERLNHFGRNPS